MTDAHNTRARSEALHRAALDLITLAVQGELDAMLEHPGRDLERATRLHDLARAHRDATGCTLETARRHIAKALRLRRGELLKARGGARPLAGRPAGSKNK